MSRVRGKETKPEILVRKFLFTQGLRYRKNVKSLPGSPDIILPKYKTAIFVHGCFWHGHKNCRLSRRPSSNKNFWNKKLDTNILRDKKKALQLKKLGWRVFTVWQCQVEERRLERLSRKIKDS
jgi:DNA mismatch endonuclease, patch repair protein